MKTTTFNTLLLIFNSTFLFSQDLIITKKGDTLNCKLIKIENEKILYNIKVSDKKLNSAGKEEWIDKTDVIYFQRDYFINKSVSKKAIRQKFNFAGGYSTLIGKTNDSIPDFLTPYIEELKTGYHLNMDYHYYFFNFLGVGFKSSIFESVNKWEVPSGVIRDHITVLYAAPSIGVNLFLAKKICLNSNLAYGKMYYQDYGSYNGNSLIFKGKTNAWDADIGLNYLIKDNFALGFDVSGTFGILKDFVIDDGVKKTKVALYAANFENLSRVNISFSLKFFK